MSSPHSLTAEINSIELDTQENCLFTESCCQTTVPEYKDAAEQATILQDENNSFDDQLRSFLIKSCGMNLKPSFKADDVSNAFKEYPLIKESLENILTRKNKYTSHNKIVKSYVIRSALMHSHSCSMDWSG